MSLKHVVTTDNVRVTAEAVGREVYVSVTELAVDPVDQVIARGVIFAVNAGELEAVLCALADARRDSQLRDREV